MNIPLKSIPLSTMIDKHIGKRGSEKREVFERKLEIELAGNRTKQVTSRKSVKTP